METISVQEFFFLIFLDIYYNKWYSSSIVKTSYVGNIGITSNKGCPNHFLMRGANVFFHASVARMARQGTANPYHAGSIPVRCSIINFYATLAQMVEHLTCNEDVVSSILTGGSIFCGGSSVG